jgi:BirA family biotin operon repressor/biotin-[acetyl-CoA-carboxylase] ligase
MALTDFQSHGKGRLNRRWEAPSGSSLLVSLLFRPNWPPQQAYWLAMMAGLAAVSAVRQETDLNPALKWPNDLVLEVEGVWHKFGGLLLEANFENDRLAYAVLGSGINVNIPPDALPEAAVPATSLLALTGRPVNRLSLLNRYLMELERLCEAAVSGQSPQPAWVERLITLGRPVRVSGGSLETTVQGTAEGVDEWGRLLVREDDGRLHTLAAGDVSLRS